jgi:hypothetical protein
LTLAGGAMGESRPAVIQPLPGFGWPVPSPQSAVTFRCH